MRPYFSRQPDARAGCCMSQRPAGSCAHAFGLMASGPALFMGATRPPPSYVFHTHPHLTPRSAASLPYRPVSADAWCCLHQ